MASVKKALVLALAATFWVAPASAAVFRLISTDLTPQLVPNSVIDMAETLGYFAREGVDVELVRVQQTPSAVAALNAHEGDMANISVDAGLQLVARDVIKMKAVISPNKSLPYLIAAKDSINSLADLSGKSFGVGRIGSVDHAMSTMVFRVNRVDPEKIEFVTLGQPNVRAQALAAGAIDATTMSIGVWLSLPDKKKLHVLVEQPDFFRAAPVIDKFNVVPDDVLRNRRSDVLAVSRALVKASRDFAQTPKIWVDAMEKARPDVKRADLEQLGEAFRKSWSVNGGLNRKELETTAAFLYQGPDYQGLRQVGFAEWVDLSIMDDVLKSIGTSPISDDPGR